MIQTYYINDREITSDGLIAFARTHGYEGLMGIVYTVDGAIEHLERLKFEIRIEREGKEEA